MFQIGPSRTFPTTPAITAFLQCPTPPDSRYISRHKQPHKTTASFPGLHPPHYRLPNHCLSPLPYLSATVSPVHTLPALPLPCRLRCPHHPRQMSTVDRAHCDRGGPRSPWRRRPMQLGIGHRGRSIKRRVFCVRRCDCRTQAPCKESYAAVDIDEVWVLRNTRNTAVMQFPIRVGT